MIFIILCIAIALFIYQMGRWIGRREAEQEIYFKRCEMGLDDYREEGER